MALLKIQDWEVLEDKSLDHCISSLERQLCPGLHQKNLASRSKEVILSLSFPLHHEMPTGVPCPALGFTVQEGHECARAGSETAHKNDLRGLEHLSYEKKTKLGLLTLKAPGTPYCDLYIQTGSVKKLKETFYQGL